MRSSFIAAIFSITIAIIAATYAAHLKQFNIAVTSTQNKMERIVSNRPLIDDLTKIFIDYKEPEYKPLFDRIKELESDSITINIYDISSKLNPNFIDFTIFKTPTLKSKLIDGITWQTLNSFREEVGFTTDTSIYNDFLRDKEELFTLHNMPNINNASDNMLKLFYTTFTRNKNKAEDFKYLLVQNRKQKKVYDDKSYRSMLTGFNKEIPNYVTIIPTWNVNFTPESLIRTVLSKKYNNKHIQDYMEKITSILNLRIDREITDKMLQNILKLRKEEKTVLTYLGTKTTFWQIDISDSKNNLKTTIIMGWYKESYRLVSLTTELL